LASGVGLPEFEEASGRFCVTGGDRCIVLTPLPPVTVSAALRFGVDKLGSRADGVDGSDPSDGVYSLLYPFHPAALILDTM